MKRFLKRNCLRPDGSGGCSSLWGVSTSTHGVAPSSDQHLWRRRRRHKFRGRRRVEKDRYCVTPFTSTKDAKKGQIFSHELRTEKVQEAAKVFVNTKIRRRNSRFIKVGTKR